MINPISIIFNFFGIKKGKIVLSNFEGRGYGCNPKYITEELLRRNIKCQIVWLTNADEREFPLGVRTVKWGGLKALYEWSTANIIITNVRMGGYFCRGFKKKQEQVYIQTWHGSMGIKKMEADCGNLSKRYLFKSRLDSKQIDYLISNSGWLTHCYRSSFFYDGKILEIGSPRNDLFFKKTLNNNIKSIKNKLGLNPGAKILLYAPTFRDNAKCLSLSLDFSGVKNVLQKRFGGEWIICVRAHPNAHLEVDCNPDIRNLTEYSDPQELLAIADCLITDYSSSAFDYVLTGRPVFLYVPDYREYLESRGLYYSLSETPFGVAESNAELIECIRSFDNKDYQTKINGFLDAKKSYDDGHAAQKIVDLIIKRMGIS